MTRNIACKWAALVALLAWSPAARAAKIACVGDSITFGYGLGNAKTESYPAVLAARLGAGHIVQNFGVSGATLLKNSDHPYWGESNFTASHDFAPDVVVVMLGTNDAKPQNWSSKAEFSADYLELIESYQALGALVYVATPPPVVPPGAFDIPPSVVADEVVPLVRAVAKDAKVPLVDVFTALSARPDVFPDTVHPNVTGAGLIAEAVLSALLQGGFAAPAVAGSGPGAAASSPPSASASYAASSTPAPGKPASSGSIPGEVSTAMSAGAGGAPSSVSAPSASSGGPRGQANGVGGPPTIGTVAGVGSASASTVASIPSGASSVPSAAASTATALGVASGTSAVPSSTGRGCDCQLGPSSATLAVYPLWGALLIATASVLRLRFRA